MKKTFRLVGLMGLAVVSYGLASCGGDGDSDGGLSITPSSVVMHYEETKQLKSEDATKWRSDNDFVATVDQNGLVTAEHVGRTQIKASNDKNSATCEIIVEPVYNLFDDPLLNWGASMKSIQSSESHEALELSSSDVLAYNYTKNSTGCIVLYNFKNNKLESVFALLNRSDYVKAGYYLLERYQPVGIGNETDVYFMDALSKDNAKTIGMLDYYKLNGTTYTCILFASISILSSKSPDFTRGYCQDNFNLPVEIEEYLSKLLVK